MATANVSTTTIELENLPNRTFDIIQDSSSTQDIVEASRVVDEGVPEGGYGWIALAACGITPTSTGQSSTSVLRFKF